MAKTRLRKDELIRKSEGESRRAEKWDYVKQLMFTPRINKDLEKLYKRIKIPKEVIEKIRDGESLYLFGDTGTGKTIWACHLLMELKKLHYIEATPETFLTITANDFLQEKRESFSDPEFVGLADQAKIYRYVLFDDIGVEKATEWGLQELYRIINFRYEEMLPTIYTSNFDPEKLREMLGDRLGRRILSCEVLEKESFNS